MHSKTCRWCNCIFKVSDWDISYLNKMSPEFNNQRFKIPEPTLCKDCRTRRRLSFRNERNLYKDNCDLCKKETLSVFSPDKNYKVYCHSCWWSDKWDPYKFGREVDFNKDFFSQFKELFYDVPFPALSNSNNENCTFVSQTANLSDCYLIFSSVESKECLYGLRINNDNSCIDGLIVENSELIYDSITTFKSYKSQFLENCTSCSNSYFLYDCIGCSDCIFCTNLRNQKYCFENKQLTKEEYLKIEEKIFQLKRTHSGLVALRARFDKFKMQNSFHKNLRQSSCENCSGDYLSHSKNGFDSFMCVNLEDCSNLFLVNDAKDVVDGNNSTGAELCYECCTSGVGGYRVLFSIDAWPQHNDVYYSYFSPNSKNLFGCSSLKRGEYSILNKKYSKNDYEVIVSKLINKMIETGEWGEFFSPALSPFGYNETCAHEWFPLTKEIALKYNFNWSTYQTDTSIPNNSIKAKDLPDNIKDVSDEIISQAIICEVSGKPYRLTKYELNWYRMENLPIPRLHPDQRHNNRIDKILPRSLNIKNCSSCKIEMISTFLSEDNVYCEKCYEDKFV